MFSPTSSQSSKSCVCVRVCVWEKGRVGGGGVGGDISFETILTQ